MATKIAKIAVSAATYWIDRPFDYLVPEQYTDNLCVGLRVTVPFGRGNKRSEGIVLSISETIPDIPLKAIETVLDEKPVLNGDMIKLALWMRERFFCTVYDAVKAMLPAGLWYKIKQTYEIAEKIDRAAAYDMAGNSALEAHILDILFANDGKCELKTIEYAFEEKNPAAALNSLVKKGAIITAANEHRKIKDKTINIARLLIPAEEAMELVRQKRKRAPHQAAVLELLSAAYEAAVRDITYFTGAPAVTIKKLIKDGYIEIESREIFRSPIELKNEVLPLPTLNDEQDAAFRGIMRLSELEVAQAALVFGVTGSGKTTIYIKLIAEMLEKGKSAILLVPEIALTPQMIETFAGHFGKLVAVLHSSLAIGERYDEWKRVKNGKARVVIGTRSAIFAPVENLGIIIIDEEQEDAYKSENNPRYHARDIAKYRCAQSDALLLLGSATPDLESRYLADSGKYSFFTLSGRYNKMELPSVQIVDMKAEIKEGNGGSISSVLRDEIAKNIEKGEQSILFLNRRGANKLVTCSECGYTYQCQNCSVSLTYHSANNRLMCHHCGYSIRVEGDCPTCGGALIHVGIGTQGVVTELEELFPDTEILRMDTDTVAPVGGHEVLLNKFREEKIPIMVGTQMVAKGLNFDNVTLVGVISADMSLYAGDYRSGERTFSLITQVVGRSGRGQKAGRAVIQTLTPENQIITLAANQDYDSFYKSEIYMRELQNAPPFTQLYAMTAVGINEVLVMKCCAFIRDTLRRELAGKIDAEILGPAPLAVVKMNGRFRYRVSIGSDDGATIRKCVSGLLMYCNTAKEFRGVSVYADINPSL